MDGASEHPARSPLYGTGPGSIQGLLVGLAASIAQRSTSMKHVWAVHHDAPRRDRFRFAEDRRDFSNAHDLLRQTLSRYADIAPAQGDFRLTHTASHRLTIATLICVDGHLVLRTR